MQPFTGFAFSEEQVLFQERFNEKQAIVSIRGSSDMLLGRFWTNYGRRRSG